MIFFIDFLKTIKLLHSPRKAMILPTDECGFISLFMSFMLMSTMSYSTIAALFQCPGSFLFAAHIFNISINMTTVHLHINKTVFKSTATTFYMFFPVFVAPTATETFVFSNNLSFH